MKPSRFKINSYVSNRFLEPMYEWINQHMFISLIKRVPKY